jgi:hypothetical protein
LIAAGDHQNQVVLHPTFRTEALILVNIQLSEVYAGNCCTVLTVPGHELLSAL